MNDKLIPIWHSPNQLHVWSWYLSKKGYPKQKVAKKLPGENITRKVLSTLSKNLTFPIHDNLPYPDDPGGTPSR